jgi:hypothetical protein
MMNYIPGIIFKKLNFILTSTPLRLQCIVLRLIFTVRFHFRNSYKDQLEITHEIQFVLLMLPLKFKSRLFILTQ